MLHLPKQKSSWCLGALVVTSVVALASAQVPTTLPAPDESITLVTPTLDKQSNSLTLPAAFWNQKLASWVEVSLCGRASDFLHETILAAAITKKDLMQSLRNVGFQDADLWANNVNEFAQSRGDQFIVLVQFTNDNKPDVYSLDELLSFENWNAPVGPYGFMFKGDPERNLPHDPNVTPIPNDATPADQILHDDPQIALTFKGLQHQSQSFADHPLAYDDWVYPALNFSRNYATLPATVYDSNGKIAVTITLQKVTEEQLLTLSAQCAHDSNYRAAILAQLPVAKQIDKDKTALKVARTLKSAQLDLLNARLAAGYATLDAAWADYASTHTSFPTKIPDEIAALKQQAARWQEHMDLNAQRLQLLTKALDLAQQQRLDPAAASDPSIRRQIVTLRSQALQAEAKQPLDFWKNELAHIDPATDPRTEWVANIRANLALATAKSNLASAGILFGSTLETDPTFDPVRTRYDNAVRHLAIANLDLDLLNINFEIDKRKDTPADPDLPGLLNQRREIQNHLHALQAATEVKTPPAPPATSP